jgi:hypothetical protein
MRFFSLFLSVLLLSAVMTAQQKRYLVSPNDEVIPIEPGKSATTAIKEWKQRVTSSNSGVCTDVFYFGYPQEIYPLTNNFGAYHKDVMGQWFTAKATGTIDTVFWEQWTAVNAYDSTVYLRIHNSNIGPSYGPGVRPGPFNPPCQNWGYWVNTNDLDQGVAAFIEEATDPTWVSTINGSAVPSGPPFSSEIWGFGGVAVQVHAATLNWYDLGVLGAPSVTIGDNFFISQRVNFNPADVPGGHREQTDEGRTEWGAAGFIVATNDEDYPARNWKFYEHDKGPSNCAGAPIDSIRRGWVARGGFSADTLDVGMWNWWYAMTVTSNVPPIIEDQTDVHTTFDTGDQTVQATIVDCNPANPVNAFVASASIKWSLNNVPQSDIPMIDLGGDVWEGVIPGQPAGSSVTWKVVATDPDAAVGQGPPDGYSVVKFGSEWYSIDTGYVCAPHDINGNDIDTSAFFNPYYTGSGTAPKDDGTAGPYDMGYDFTLFGDNFRYAWIGVNGAIGLSKTATDTIHVNANGFATTVWNFPYPQWHGVDDTVGAGLMPPMFVSPFWADHIVGDTTGQFGNIRYGNDGDTCLFIVQWDSVGAFDNAGSSPDITTFRVVLNKCTGIVEYEYESVGTFGLDSAALVGLQADSSAISGPVPGYVFENRLGYPIETRPADNTCVRFIPKIASAVNDGWNMVAVSLDPIDVNYGKAQLFPSAVSPAYKYAAGYVVADPLEKGVGYWMKFDGSGSAGNSPSTFTHSLVASVNDKWNMIGGPSTPAPTSSIVAGGGTSVTSSYFGYGSAGYSVASTIFPGKGYWVKVSNAGTLTMTGSAAAPKAAPTVIGETNLAELNKITITDAYGRSQTLYLGDEGQVRNELSFFELPPTPPAGAYDVRFVSQRMVESYPAVDAAGKSYEYPISIQSAAYPVSIRWEMNAPVTGNRKMVLSDVADGKSIQQVMEGSGYYVIKNANVKSVVVKLSEGVNVPATYALSRNYPNPFNPVTRFTVDLPRATEVEVAVYDLLGRKIASLMNGTQAAGTYTLEWNAHDANGMVVPTGMYLLRVSSEEFNASQKIMLMK